MDGWMAAIPSLWRGLIMSFEKINFQLIGNDDGTGWDEEPSAANGFIAFRSDPKQTDDAL